MAEFLTADGVLLIIIGAMLLFTPQVYIRISEYVNHLYTIDEKILSQRKVFGTLLLVLGLVAIYGALVIQYIGWLYWIAGLIFLFVGSALLFFPKWFVRVCSILDRTYQADEKVLAHPRVFALFFIVFGAFIVYIGSSL